MVWGDCLEYMQKLSGGCGGSCLDGLGRLPRVQGGFLGDAERLFGALRRLSGWDGETEVCREALCLA